MNFYDITLDTGIFNFAAEIDITLAFSDEFSPELLDPTSGGFSAFADRANTALGELLGGAGSVDPPTWIFSSGSTICKVANIQVDGVSPSVDIIAAINGNAGLVSDGSFESVTAGASKKSFSS